MKMSADQDILLVEVRDSVKKKVSFSAVNSKNGSFLWKDVVFEEPWWMSLNSVVNGMALFTIYTETNNPDRKAIFAYDIAHQNLVWWNNDFSLIKVFQGAITGISSKYNHREITLDVRDGSEIEAIDVPEQSDPVLRPFQYVEEQAYFETVKTFLTTKFNLMPVNALEYLEYNSMILISFYTGIKELANHLMILTSNGDIVMQEKIDEHLKGIGLDTFFIYAGSVFFVKNKGELFSYKIV